MKNEVRPIDANAAIEALRANFQQGSWYGCEEPCYQIAEDTISEMPTLTDHFREATKMIPLTMEQLREMDGQPVWVKVIGKTGIRCDGWCEVEIREKDPFAYVWWPGSEVEDIAKIEDYGKTWACYAYQPAHIDREAWECPLCSSYEVISFKAWKKPEQVIGGPFAQGGAMFCPHCGKPRTPESWAKLEKRMGVR